MILPGVTRDSVLALARDHASGKNKLEGLPDKFEVVEKNVTSSSFPSPLLSLDIVLTMPS
jgi:hypothetical protein